MGRSLLAALLVIAAMASAPATAHADLTFADSGFSTVRLAAGLLDPTALAYAPDGRLFITEKAGRLRVVSPQGQLAAAPVIDISGHVADQGDRGLLGVAVDSAFATNRIVYLLYTYEDPADPGNPIKTARLTRISVNADNSVQDPIAPETVLLGTTGTAPCPPPSNTSDCIPSTSDSHSIGTVRSDSDGTLWVGSGDGAQFNWTDTDALRTYDEQSLSGKILHIDRQGRGLPSHPFCQGESNLDLVCTKLHAKGFRNPFRFHLRPGAGPVAGDVGWGSREEIDFVEPGRSYGWPCYEGSERTFSYQDLDECQTQYAIDPPAHTPPAFDYAHEAGAAAQAGPRYTGDRYPQAYRNAWFYADYVQGWIKLYDLDGQGNAVNHRTLATAGYSGGVDLETAPNGDLVFVNFGDGSAGTGTVERIVYGNAAPPAKAHATPSFGPAPLTVQLSADESIDPDGDAVSYEWDFESDGTPDAATRTATHVYPAGCHNATLTVTDARGLASTDTVLITPDETPPTAAIQAPAPGSLFRHGEPVSLRGSGTDPEDGDLSGDALDWRIVLHHGSHIHLVGGERKGAVQTFTPPGDHDADSYYEIQLTATDSVCMVPDTATVEIRPETVELTLASYPPGAALDYSGLGFTAPQLLTAAIGYRTSVSAPEQRDHDGRAYRFERWSDGGARQHQIVVPDTDATLTATYEAMTPTPPSSVLNEAPPRPRLTIDAPAARRARALTGRLTGSAEALRVRVALRTPLAAGRCRRWYAAPRGRLGRLVRRCDRPVWMRATLTRAGPSAWRWRVPLGGAPPARRYVVLTRAANARGRIVVDESATRLRLR